MVVAGKYLDEKAPAVEDKDVDCCSEPGVIEDDDDAGGSSIVFLVGVRPEDADDDDGGDGDVFLSRTAFELLSSVSATA